MKKQKYRQLFQDAERLTPPPGLWRRIEAQVEMQSGRTHSASFWGSPFLRVAASVVLAVGFLGLGLFVQHGSKVAVSRTPSAVANAAEGAGAEQMDLVDPELLGWHADLGEIDMEADEAEEVL